MTPIRQIDTGVLVYSVVDDFTSVYRAVITGVITDEIFGALNAADLKIETDRPDLDTKTTNGGAFAVIGYVDRSFPLLKVQSYTVNLTVSAPGFRDFKVPVTINANPTLPVPGPSIALRRTPVRVQGRVVADTASRAPIPGALVMTVDDPSAPPPATHVLSLRSALSLAHAAGSAIRAIGMVSFGGATLGTDALSGTQTLDLSNRAGLAAGSVIQLSNATGTQVTYVVVAAPVTGPGAGTVGLRDPLDTSFFAATASAQFLNPGAPGPSGTLASNANAGDGVLLSSAVLSGSTLQIEPGSPSAEYRETGALTDADGYYAIDGVGRASEIFLQASHSGFTAKVSPWMVEYDSAVNVLDFRL